MQDPGSNSPCNGVQTHQELAGRDGPLNIRRLKEKMEIYIQRNNSEHGPYSREVVLEYIRDGILKASDLARAAGENGFRPLSEILGPTPAADYAPQPIPLPIRKQTVPVQAQTPPEAKKVQAQVLPEEKKHSTGMILLNLVLIAVVIGAAYVKFGGGEEEFQHFVAFLKGTPADEETTGASTAPEPVAATPVPVPLAAATPRPFDITDLAAQPAAWPKTVRLKQSIAFPAIYQQEVVGSVTAPAGSEVGLLGIEGGLLDLKFNGGTQKVDWKLTDLKERFEAAGSRP